MSRVVSWVCRDHFCGQLRSRQQRPGLHGSPAGRRGRHCRLDCMTRCVQVALRPALHVASLQQVLAAICTQRSSLFPHLAPELLHATSAGCWGAPPEAQVPELFEAPFGAQSVKPGLLICFSCSSIGKPARKTGFTADRWIKALQEAVQLAGLVGLGSQDVWWAGRRIR